jgi:hypothetical protein
LIAPASPVSKYDFSLTWLSHDPDEREGFVSFDHRLSETCEPDCDVKLKSGAGSPGPGRFDANALAAMKSAKHAARRVRPRCTIASILLTSSS